MVSSDEIAGPQSYYLKEQIYTGALVFFYRKYTPWVKKFDDGIQRLIEAGLVNKWFTELMNSNQVQLNDQVSGENAPLNIIHLQGPFMLLGAGSIISFLIFLIELCVGIKRRKKIDEKLQI